MELSQAQSFERREQVEQWFRSLRDRLCSALESVEEEFVSSDAFAGSQAGRAYEKRFRRKLWQREEENRDGREGTQAEAQATTTKGQKTRDTQPRADSRASNSGGGEMSVMRGEVFEKVGVNISTVYGTLVPELRSEVRGSAGDGRFWASGISLVAHPRSPLVPAAHFNTRYIESAHGWFGGGGDLTPSIPDPAAREMFHAEFRRVCDKYKKGRYRAYAKACDDYFYIRHRRCARGAGGIFYDNLSDDWQSDFAFTRDVGEAFLNIFPKLVRERFDKDWNEEQRAQQLRVRGYYTEFNLIYDRGTRFGLLTNGNPEAVLMSLPPLVAW